MTENAFERGDNRRREVLGDAHVDRSDAGKSEFTEEFMAFISFVARL